MNIHSITDKKVKKVKALALFWRYGLWIVMLISIYTLGVFFHVHPYLTVAVFMIGDGIYTVIIAALLCEHFICGMQNAYHMKMTPYHSHPKEWLAKIKREGCFIGAFFSVLGLALLIAWLLNI